MLNDGRVASACSYVRTCQRVRNSQTIETIRDFQVYICVNSTITIISFAVSHHLHSLGCRLQTAFTKWLQCGCVWGVFAGVFVWVYGGVCVFLNQKSNIKFRQRPHSIHGLCHTLHLVVSKKDKKHLIVINSFRNVILSLRLHNTKFLHDSCKVEYFL